MKFVNICVSYFYLNNANCCVCSQKLETACLKQKCLEIVRFETVFQRLCGLQQPSETTHCFLVPYCLHEVKHCPYEELFKTMLHFEQ